MPATKEKNRRIYITALVISFLLIVGSIYLHLKQKTHLGRMSFNLDRERVQPTGGVEATTWLNDYNDANTYNQTNDNSNSEDDTETENSSMETSPSSVSSYDTSERFVTPNQTELENDRENEKSTENSSEENNDKPTRVMDNNDDYLGEEIDLNAEYDMRSLGQHSNACLRCLCMTVNECRPTFCGSGNPCGLYRISKRYWMDAGKPTIAGGTTDNEDQDYLTCVNEDSCATAVIRQYYDRYKRDCNKDGVLDCRDQIALHLLGPSGCLTNNLSYIHANRMKNCLIESNLNYYSYSEEEYDEYLP